MMQDGKIALNAKSRCFTSPAFLLYAIQEILDPGIQLAFTLRLIYLHDFHFGFLSVDRLAALSVADLLRSVFTV